MNIVLDTTFLLSIMHPLDVYTTKAANMLLQHSDDDFLIPFVVQNELLMSNNPPEKVEQLCATFCSPCIAPVPADLEFIASWAPATRKSLKIADCQILATCKRYNAKLFTFEKKLERAAKKLLS